MRLGRFGGRRGDMTGSSKKDKPRRYWRWFGVVAVLVIVAAGVVSGSSNGLRFPKRTMDGYYFGISMKGARVPACRTLTGPAPERVAACLSEIDATNLSDPIAGLLGELRQGDRPVLVLGKLPEMSVGDLSYADLREPTQEMLWGSDGAALAHDLASQNIRGVALHRDMRGALDEDATLFSRLAYHNHLEWFQLRHVSEEWLIYTVRTSTMRLPQATGQELLLGLRARLEGQPATPLSWRPQSVRLMASLRGQGSMLVIRHAVGDDIEEVLDELAASLRRSWERDVVPEGRASLDESLSALRLEIHVVMERAPVEPRSRYAIFDLWEMGVDGMMFKQRPGQDPEKFTFMPGSEMVTRSHRSADQFLRFAVKRGGWHDLRPWSQDRRTRLSLIRTQHFMESALGGGDAVRLVRGVPDVSLDAMTEAHIRSMLVRGGDWWMHNMKESGRIEYKYWPVQNRRSDDYNEVRHILATRDLADTWRYQNDPRYLEGSRRAMDWLLAYEVDASSTPQGPMPHPPEGTTLFRYPSYEEMKAGGRVSNQKLGTVAVALLGWVAWADATGSDVEDERIRKMAKFVLSMLEKDGRFRPYYVQYGHAYEHERNDIVPGEAMLALAMVADYFDELEWVEPYPKFLAYYQPWFRELAAKQQATGRWPRDTYDNETRLELVQFGPWSVMAAAKVYQLTGDEEAAKFGLDVADWMIDNYQWSTERSAWPEFVGGYYKMPIELPAMQTFCYSEGTAAAYAIAKRFDPERAKKYEQSTLEAIRFLEVMQYDALDSYFLARPQQVDGGIKYAMNENKIRIDYVGHGLSTLSQYLDALALDVSEDATPPEVP